MSDWKSIDTAPTLERILVAGWQEMKGPVQSYWWYYEDHTDENGKPMEWPDALMWQKWPKPPQLPPKPT
jgi:hypothetical protein